MSIGALMGGPVSGWSLDKYGPWIPISVTASCCAFGCLWRGLAGSITSLRMGAILLGIGVNLWTVVLGHTVKSFSSKLRSEVLAGFSVQMTRCNYVVKEYIQLLNMCFIQYCKLMMNCYDIGYIWDYVPSFVFMVLWRC